MQHIVENVSACMRTSTGSGVVMSPFTSAICSAYSTVVDVDDHAELAAVVAVETVSSVRSMIVSVRAAIGDQVGDRADLQAVQLGERHQVRQPGHGAVVVHDLADHAGRVQPGQRARCRPPPRCGRRGPARRRRAPPAGRRGPGRRCRRGPCVGIDGDGDGAGAVGGRDAGGDALARLDRHGEGGADGAVRSAAPSAAGEAARRARAVMARQIRPRPKRAMKLIASGVANCAGMTRSPSFSRSSSSTRTNMRPWRASSSDLLDGREIGLIGGSLRPRRVRIS